MTRRERVYTALLLLYPRSFRVEYGEAMLETFRAASRDTRRTPASFWLFIAEDLCRSACHEHFREMRPDLIYVARCTVASVLTNAILVGSVTVAAAMVGPPRAITEDLRVADLRTGWSEVPSPESGTNKVVPWMTLTLRQLSPMPIGFVNLIVDFRRAGDANTWGAVYVPMVRPDDGLRRTAPAPLVIRSQRGYTSTEPSTELIRKTQFADVRVKVFARRGSSPRWQALGEWRVQHELLEP